MVIECPFAAGLVKMNHSLRREDCQHIVTDKFLCLVTDCALGTDVCQQDSLLIPFNSFI